MKAWVLFGGNSFSLVFVWSGGTFIPLAPLPPQATGHQILPLLNFWGHRSAQRQWPPRTLRLEEAPLDRVVQP